MHPGGSFKHFLSTYYASGVVLRARDIVVKKIDAIWIDPFPDGALTSKPQKDCDFDFTTNKASFHIQLPKEPVPKQIYKRANKDREIKCF